MNLIKLYKASAIVLGLFMCVKNVSALNGRALGEWFGQLEEILEMSNPFWVEQVDHKEKDKSGSLKVVDKEAVKLPEVVIEYDAQNDDDKKNKSIRSFSLIIKGIDASKESINVELDEDNGYAELIIPHENAQVTIKIYPTGYSVSSEKKITQEKKDDKGNVLGSSSYVGYNSYSRSFPYAVNVNSIDPVMKDKDLKINFGKRDAKRIVAIK